MAPRRAGREACRMNQTLTIRGATVRVRVATANLTITEHTIPAGFPGPPLHVHPVFDEAFVVLEGALTLRAGDAVSDLRPGETLHVSGSVPHTFANPDGEPARFLVAMAPGGFEAYFAALAAGDDELVAAVSERFGYAPA
jgi:mannose-6-phosphate isomerase-like protein (cupin superfamily)